MNEFPNDNTGLIMFKECLKYNIVPFIIDENLKMFYYRGLKEWDHEQGYLTGKEIVNLINAFVHYDIISLVISTEELEIK